MKRVLSVSLLLNGFLAALLWLKAAPAHAGSSPPAGNGDVNADGAIDISDAIYLLSALFTGGPAPKAIECPAAVVTWLPATGQVGCYDELGDLSCNSPDAPGQDGFYEAGCPTASRFVDNGDGTVTDTCTALMWQKDTADLNTDGKINDSDHATTWKSALKYCENLTFAGHDDWRLPNVRELASLLDYGQTIPAIPSPFGALDQWYWTSTTESHLTGLPLLVHFRDGLVSIWNGNDGRGTAGFIRAVRNAP